MIGVMTEDFALYHDLVQFLKRASVRFETLSPRRAVPKKVTVVLTSEAEAAELRFPDVVAVKSLEGSVVLARSIDRRGRGRSGLVVGIDPGERIGFAVLSGGELIFSGRVHSPDGIAELLRAISAATGNGLLIKVGHGAPTVRNRIISLLHPLGAEILVVDESLTSKRSRRGLDEDAAAHIATMHGAHVEGPLSSEPTAGEVRDIQRKSRIASSGEVTIDRQSARMVGTGEISLREAVERARAKKRK
jgi:hypothetical protein